MDPDVGVAMLLLLGVLSRSMSSLVDFFVVVPTMLVLCRMLVGGSGESSIVITSWVVE